MDSSERCALAGWLLRFTLCALLGGCATQPERIMHDPVSPAEYADYDCDQLAMEIVYVGYRVRALYEWQSAERKRDVWLASFSWFYGVTVPFIHGDGPEAQQYRQLRGAFEALRVQALGKGCGFEDETPEGVVLKAKHWLEAGGVADDR